MRGQSYSLDLIIAVVMFILVIAVFYTFINKEADAPTRKLQRVGEVIAVKLDKNEKQHLFAVIEGSRINYEELSRLYNTSYEELKQQLGVANDFCIYMEDGNGRIILVDNKTGIGNPDLMVAGTPCGQAVT